MMRRLDKQLTESIVETEKLRQRNVKLFVAKLNKFLAKHIRKIVTIDDQTELDEAASVLGGLQEGLRQAGLGKVVDDLQTAYADELSAISTRYTIAGYEAALSSINGAAVESLLEQDFSKVANLISPYIDDVTSTILRAVVGGEKPDVDSILERATDLIEHQVETEVNTLLSGFSRSVTANRAAELGLELFLYVGPEDKVTRDFCEELLQKDPPIYTREEIEAMDNDQGLSAMTYGGGYNCRHQWAAVSPELAEEMGYTIGD